MDVRTVADPRLLHATTAIPVAAGTINSGTTGAQGDSLLVSVVILLNAAAVTLTIVGFDGEDGSARNVVLTGQTTVDTVYNFGTGLRNTGAAMTLTASVADKVLVAVTQA